MAGSILRGCVVLLIGVALLGLASCQIVRYGEMTSRGNALPYHPGYFDFVSWEVCDRLFGGGSYLARIPLGFVFNHQKMKLEGFKLETPKWSSEGAQSGLMCMSSQSVDGVRLPYEAFGRPMYVRYQGRSADYIVPSLKIGFGGSDPR
jgi:hypothetical protein